MVVNLASARGCKSFTKHMWYRPSLGRKVGAVRFDQAIGRREWPRGVYLFTDADRATSGQRGFMSILWEEMSARPDAFRVLNHPVRHLGRFDLLRSLYEDGTNDFNVHRLNELGDGMRYPVFLRAENQHIGSYTPLLGSQGEVEVWAARLAGNGIDLSSTIAVEFLDTTCDDGLYRKYGAFRVGGRIVPRHLLIGREWEMKVGTNSAGASHRAEEFAYLCENPHAEEVMRVFGKAGLEYGRIDYSLKDGRIQVWEINDNPQINSSINKYWKGRFRRALYFLKGLEAAVDAVGEGIEPGPPVTIDLGGHRVWGALCNP